MAEGGADQLDEIKPLLELSKVTAYVEKEDLGIGVVSINEQ